MSGFKSLNTKNLLKVVVIFQYVPRLIRIIPLYKEVTRTSGILTETAWAGAAFNLLLYMLASHVSLYYILLTYVFMELFLAIFLSITCLFELFTFSFWVHRFFLLNPLIIYLFNFVPVVLFYQQVHFVLSIG